MPPAPSSVRTLIAVVLALTVAGCGDDDPPITGPPPPAALQLASVSPGSGSSAATTPITLTGLGFESGTTLTVGGTPVPLTVITLRNARAAVPPHAAGPVDVVVTNPNGERALLTGGFRYVDVPVRLELTGNSALQSVGETSQLTATATFADGTTLDVTRQAQWSTTFPSIATIGSDGVLTARALGLSSFFVRFPVTNPSLSRSGMATVTPAGTFALAGRVREPGSGNVGGARVVHVESGQAVDATANGDFVLAGLSGQPRVRVTKDGYEDSDRQVRPNEYLDTPIQRIVHLQAGATALTSQLAPNDVEHQFAPGTFCQPCRLIRLTTATPGNATVTLRWSGPATLQLWVNGRAFQAPSGVREITAEIPLVNGDTIVFVGRLSAPTIEDYIPFNVVVRQ